MTGDAAEHAPPPAALAAAEAALQCATKAGIAGERADEALTVIDFSLPSTAPRLWVLDPKDGTVTWNVRVAHGRTSGEDLAVHFSNVPHSNASSIGLYRTGEVYVGKHGRSLRLDGLDEGWNDNARARDIVIHGADYCTGEHVEKWGRLGRSQGCPALDPAVTAPIIDTIKDGTLVLVYYPDPDWLAASPWLHCGG